MIKTGLVSVSFRSLDISEIINLTKRAGLSAIEWGGDVHVPHGDISKAYKVRKSTLDAGLEISGYGSYYRAGEAESLQNPPFSDVLKSAVALGAPVIRIWAGAKGSKEAGKRYRSTVIKDSRRAADIAASEKIKVAFEYHAGSLTDEMHSAKQLMEEIDHPNCKCFWQPACGIDETEKVQGLEMILPWLSNIHVFNWVGDYERRQLLQGYDKWAKYFDIISKAKGDRYALLEFVKGDDPEQLIKDARALKDWLSRL